MPKPAIIELDSTIANLRVFCRQQSTHYRQPTEAQLLTAAQQIFEDFLAQALPGRMWKPHDGDQLSFRVAETFQWVPAETADETAQFDFASDLVRIDQEISEHLYGPLIEQIQKAVSSDIYYAWRCRYLGTAVVLNPGGILINLDRVLAVGGIVELDLREHWANAPTKDEEEDLDKQLDKLTRTRATKRFESNDANGVKVTKTEPGLKAREKKRSPMEQARMRSIPAPTMPERFEDVDDRREGWVAPEVFEEPTTETVIYNGEHDYLIIDHSKPHA